MQADGSSRSSSLPGYPYGPWSWSELRAAGIVRTLPELDVKGPCRCNGCVGSGGSGSGGSSGGERAAAAGATWFEVVVGALGKHKSLFGRGGIRRFS